MDLTLTSKQVKEMQGIADVFYSFGTDMYHSQVYAQEDP